MEKLKIVISSGGTDVPIDDVRVISNSSAGTTGAKIAEEALIKGHEVHLIRSKNAKSPFENDLRGNPLAKDLTQEALRISKNLNRIAPMAARLDDERVKDFDSYQKRLLQVVSDPKIDVAILSMAASDFGPVKSDGKISSDSSGIELSLKPLPKIISQVRPANRNIFLVGFKFLPDGTAPDQLIESAYKSLLRDKQDLTVANAGQLGTSNLFTYLVTLEKGVIPVQERNNLPAVLLKSIEETKSKQHFSTRLSKVDIFALQKGEVDNFIDNIHDLSNLALFNPYLEGSRTEFGFVAKRTERGTLITGRASSKSQADIDDLALVTEVDEESRTLFVESTGKKASLNANATHLMLKERPEINFVIHTHIPLPEAKNVEKLSQPGTKEDWERMRELVVNGEKMIFQPGHGVILLLESLDELLPILSRQNIYKTRPEVYDLAYARFQNNRRFLDIVQHQLPKTSAVLDFGAGTGALSRELFTEGYKDLTLADTSDGMLAVAKTKLPEISSNNFIKQDFEAFSSLDIFDGVLMRQCVNYIAPERLVETFSRIKKSLRNNGRFIFNSFDPKGLSSILRAVRRDQVGSSVVLTQEGNMVTNNLIYHGQRSEIFNTENGGYQFVYDLNSFYPYSKEFFQKALMEAGFSEVNLITENRSVYFLAS